MNSIGQSPLFIDQQNAAQRLQQTAERQQIAVLPDGTAEGDKVTLSADSSTGESVTEAYEKSMALVGFEIEFPTKADIGLFGEQFSKALAKAGISSEGEIELHSDPDGTVRVTNDHPDKDRIEKLFADDESLRNQYIRADTAQLMQTIHQLHQQWQQHIDSGADEEAAGIWLVQAVQAAVSDNEGITVKDGAVVDESTPAVADRSPAAVIQRIRGLA